MENVLTKNTETNKASDCLNCLSFKIKSIILLSFDNEIGQLVDKEFPNNSLKKEQLKFISIMGFPETNTLMEDEELGFIFKIRVNNNVLLKSLCVKDHKFFFCYALYIQLKCKENKRGYIQKSIIIISDNLNKYFYFKLLYILKDLLIYKFEYQKNSLNNVFDKSFNELSITFTELERFYNIVNNDLKINYNNLKDESIITDLNNKISIVNILDNFISYKNLNSLDNISSKNKCNYIIENSNNTNNIKCISDKSEVASDNYTDNTKSNSLEENKNQNNILNKNYNINNNNSNNHIKNNNFFNKLKTLENFYNINYSWDLVCNNISLNDQFNNFLETFSLFYIAKLWQIWELIVLEYPIIVYSDNASRVSNIVFLLESITRPLPLNSDVRPYFSMYDMDFKEYKEEKDMRLSNSAILGVINPIFNKIITDWPVVLRFDSTFFEVEQKNKIPVNPLDKPLSQNNTKYYESKVYKKNSSSIYEVKNFFNKDIKKRKFSLKSNSQIIGLFLDCLKEEGDNCYNRLNCHIRMYFSELTNDFLKTIHDFILLNEIKDIKRLFLQKKKESIGIFEIFNREKFIKYLKEKSEKNAFNYKYIHSNKKLINLYTNFLDTKCFRNYLIEILDLLKQSY